jgi:TrmH family RNA methyltransferase
LLTPSQTNQIEIILVSPRNPLNIGAAARAMANFGFQRLTIVAPFAENWMQAKSAVGAPDLLRDAKVIPTLAEAVANCTLVLGTGSLDRRKPEQTTLDLPAASSLVREALNQQPSKIAILFGSEKHGLTTEDLSWCHAVVVIDTAQAQPSMNLGQAVAVCLYEISRTSASGHAADSLTQAPLIKISENPTNSQLDRLAELIEETMAAANYATRGMRSANGEALRVLLRRLMPNEPDLRRMMGLFRRILWQLAKHNGKS